MTTENVLMKMRPVVGGLEIKPGETVTLKPAGVHLMLLDLKHPLEQGKMVEATLQFSRSRNLPNASYVNGQDAPQSRDLPANTRQEWCLAVVSLTVYAGIGCHRPI
jgi:copper(I)-binding protein